MRYEYKVLPAPRRGRKSGEVKSAEGRFALGIEEQINELAHDGWEYLRSDILPSDERQGLTSTRTVYRSVLVFRRALSAAAVPPDQPTGPRLVATEPPPDAPEAGPDRDGETP